MPPVPGRFTEPGTLRYVPSGPVVERCRVYRRPEKVWNRISAPPVIACAATRKTEEASWGLVPVVRSSRLATVSLSKSSEASAGSWKFMPFATS